jgi:hypothetical protein
VHYLASKYLVYYDETFWNFGHHNLSKKERTGPPMGPYAEFPLVHSSTTHT